MPLGCRTPRFPGGRILSTPAADPVTVPNHLVNFGWEYVWHCHILAHEEMDMMHSQAVSVNQPGSAPIGLMSDEVTNTATNTTAVYLSMAGSVHLRIRLDNPEKQISRMQTGTTQEVPSYTTPEIGRVGNGN